MPRRVAFKDPKWTGRIIWVGDYNEFGGLSGPKCIVRIDGVVHGPRLTGRVLDDQDRPTRTRYYFKGPDRSQPGLPDWCRIVRRCKVCGHTACPFCGSTCDAMLNDDGDMCCDGECTYDEPDPYMEDDLDDFAEDFRKALS